MFVLKEDGSLISLKPAQFVLEDDFQRLLEDHPELLAGELIDPDKPRRWLLVGREIGIPGEADGAGWLSADLLFLDQDGIPTIVEVKRQTDPRLRRVVVGQMLDYAANAVAYLPVASIRTRFEETCAKNEKDSETELQAILGQEIDSEKFWQQVKTNLGPEDSIALCRGCNTARTQKSCRISKPANEPCGGPGFGAQTILRRERAAHACSHTVRTNRGSERG